MNPSKEQTFLKKVQKRMIFLFFFFAVLHKAFVQAIRISRCGIGWSRCGIGLSRCGIGWSRCGIGWSRCGISLSRCGSVIRLPQQVRRQGSTTSLDGVVSTSVEDELPELLNGAQSLVETGGLANPGLRQSSHKPGNHKLRQMATAKVDQRHLNVDRNAVVQHFQNSTGHDCRNCLEELFREVHLPKILGTNRFCGNLESQGQAANDFIFWGFIIS